MASRTKTNGKPKLRTAHILALGFAALIFAGSGLLCLPGARTGGISYADALFTSASSVCVAGLSAVGVSSFSAGGQVIILFLMQAGGLGFMTMATLIFLVVRKRMTLRDRIAIAESMNTNDMRSLARLTKNVVLLALVTEFAGFMALLPFYAVNFGAVGVWQALFMSVSAYCNTGFTLAGGEETLAFFNAPGAFGGLAAPFIISVLVIIGGLGAIVVLNAVKERRFSRFSLHTKLVLGATGILLLSSFVMLLALEYGNPATFGEMSFFKKAGNAWFAAVMPRSGGFVTVPSAGFTGASKMLVAGLMFIGAAPASTGGGIKVTTLAVLVMTIRSGLKGREDVWAFRRAFSRRAVFRSIAVVLFSGAAVFASVCLLMFTERGAASASSSGALAFEAVSAAATSGLSLGVTPFLTTAGKLVVAALMLAGRIGPLTVGMAFARGRRGPAVKLLESSVMIG